MFLWASHRLIKLILAAFPINTLNSADFVIFQREWTKFKANGTEKGIIYSYEKFETVP